MDYNNPVEAIHIGMGTKMAHKAFGKHATEALRAVEHEAHRLECLLSRFLPGSDISRVNLNSGKRNETVSNETFEILSFALKLSTISKGLFDITVGPLVDLWDYKNAIDPPSGNELKQILPLVNYKDLILDSIQKTAALKKPGQSVDLGGIGKGFASDCLIEMLQEYDVKSAFSNIGGNVSTLGNKPDGSPWWVGIRHPRQNGLLGAVAVNGKAVVTSGDYERYFIGKDGKRYHHILNPITGYPSEAGLVSVTIVADSAMTADALSTAVFVSGLERGLDMIEKNESEAILVDENLRIYVTKGLQKPFKTSFKDINYL